MTDAELLSLIRSDLEHIIRCCEGRYEDPGRDDGYRVVGRLWLAMGPLARLINAGVEPAPTREFPDG